MCMILTGELSWQRLRRSAVDFYSKNAKIALSATLSGLRGNVRIPSIAGWKAHGRLYIRHNWTFSRYLLRLRRYKRKSIEVGVFRRGWVTLSADFRGKEASPTNNCWCESSRVIALSCGIKISAVHHSDLSQFTRVTDRQTDGRTDGQNYDYQLDRPRICSRGKIDWLIDRSIDWLIDWLILFYPLIVTLQLFQLLS